MITSRVVTQHGIFMYQPFYIGNRFRIVPPGFSSTIDGQINLVMQRGAFGSGEHETTESCLELLETLPELTGAKVLDLGSGTGILAIAALKLGANRAICVDIEEKAVETAKVNCSLNKVDDQATHIVGNLNDIPERGFDLILANIYGDILLSLAPILAEKAKSGAVLILSGILWEDNFEVRQTYERQGCVVIKNRILEEFSSLLLKKSL